jgi:hypothetical protein
LQSGKEGNEFRNEYLFHHLVVMFQTLALQQLGKLMSPITGKVERDLQQARITIDMLQMIREKTAGNVTDREKGLLDGVLMELQLNYVDELNRGEETPEAEGAAEAERERETVGSAAGESNVARGSAERETEPEKSEKKKEAAKKSAKRKTTKRKAKAKKAKPDSDSRK